ncbi:replication protein A 70 kDa DNA-binding subunit-like isoform X2 [Nasonia vitripennis]|uniref:Replication factor-A protein 1 N-terminal domain-containing protein n=1 Tax=Nasonia vitripennis TaxID=7425 RepID=A0A7M7GCA0_NASVI|nr:replication protein A 70 kDa DNA-binding subunit-like isoform X2 [Nasonia vitripennis]
MNGEEIEFEPILQVLALKKITNFAYLAEDKDRFRLKLSDGRTYNSFVMLGTPLNFLVHSNFLTEYSILKIKNYVITHIKVNGQTKSVMVILNSDVLAPGHEVKKVLGSVDVAFIDKNNFNFSISMINL